MSGEYELRFRERTEAQEYYAATRARLGGAANIAGLDEVGRGPCAGAVVVGCVILPVDHGIEGIRDSKRLSHNRREQLAKEILAVAVSVGFGCCENEEVDKLNIFQATHVAARRAIKQCLVNAPIDFLFCDGGLDLRDAVVAPVRSVIKGDDLLECIGAASIVAKVYRDTQMDVYHEIWPEYGFNSNRGYGTAAHIAALKRYGLSPIHRRTFRTCYGLPDRQEMTNEQEGTVGAVGGKDP